LIECDIDRRHHVSHRGTVSDRTENLSNCAKHPYRGVKE